jgi:hypothetical protein
MTEKKPFEIGDIVTVVEEVGDPQHRYVVVEDEKGRRATVDKQSLSKVYPITLLYLTGRISKKDLINYVRKMKQQKEQRKKVKI